MFPHRGGRGCQGGDQGLFAQPVLTSNLTSSQGRTGWGWRAFLWKSVGKLGLFSSPNPRHGGGERAAFSVLVPGGKGFRDSLGKPDDCVLEFRDVFESHLWRQSWRAKLKPPGKAGDIPNKYSKSHSAHLVKRNHISNWSDRYFWWIGLEFSIDKGKERQHKVIFFLPHMHRSRLSTGAQ